MKPFGDAVLHLEHGSGRGVGYNRFPTSNSVVAIPSVGLVIHMPAGTAQVVGVPPHFEEPAKPRRTIFLRVLFQK